MTFAVGQIVQDMWSCWTTDLYQVVRVTDKFITIVRLGKTDPWKMSKKRAAKFLVVQK